MRWDGDAGIDSFRFSGIAEHIDNSTRLLELLLESTHPAVIESAIQGLGHIMDDFWDRCEPNFEYILFRGDVSRELHEYASNVLDHYIQ